MPKQIIPFDPSSGDTSTTAESTQLEELEAVIERNMDAVVAVGKALREIQENKLYLAEYRTFARYIEERWKMSRSHAYRQIQFVKDVEMSPVGDKPKAERAARKRREQTKATAKPSELPEQRAITGLEQSPRTPMQEVQSQFYRWLDLIATLPEEERFQLLDWAEDECDDEREELEDGTLRKVRVL
jgi:hypothetical protein